MKKLIPSLIVGLIGGIGGSLIFEPIGGIMDIFLSDFAIGGVIIGGIVGFLGLKSTSTKKLLIYSLIIGLAVFFLFGLLSGKMIDDLIAGAVIGLFVGLVANYFGSKVEQTVDSFDNN